MFVVYCKLLQQSFQCGIFVRIDNRSNQIVHLWDLSNQTGHLWDLSDQTSHQRELSNQTGHLWDLLPWLLCRGARQCVDTIWARGGCLL